MRFSYELPTQRADRPDQFVSAAAIAELTRAAADAGFDSVNVSDHPAPDARWLDRGGHHALDPFVALSFAAAADPRIALFTNIYVAAYRNPFLGAKLVQSLDVLSEGRLILGVAAGYLKPEFAALGVDFDRRGALLDEALAVLDEALTGGDVAREGAGFTARGVRFRPPTPSGGRPPVWVGGNSKAAIRRAVRYEGWAPFHTAGFAVASRTTTLETVEDITAAIRYVREQRRSSGAAEQNSFDICWSEHTLGDPARSVDERCSRLEALAEAGVTWVALPIPGEDRDEVLANLSAFAADVLQPTAR